MLISSLVPGDLLWLQDKLTKLHYFLLEITQTHTTSLHYRVVLEVINNIVEFHADRIYVSHNDWLSKYYFVTKISS